MPNPATAAEADRDTTAASCWGYIGPDGEKKLPLCVGGKLDARHVGAAHAALTVGYRGQKVQLPSGAKSAALAKVNAARKKLGLDGDGKQSAEFPDALHARQYGDLIEVAALAFDDGAPAPASGPDAGDVHVPGPTHPLVKQMRRFLKGRNARRGGITLQDFEDGAKRLAPRKPMAQLATTEVRLAECDLRPWRAAEDMGDALHDGLFVGAFLDDDGAGALALPGGEAPEDLHVTLAYLPGVDLDDLQFARAVVAIGDACRWIAKVEGAVSGHGRFYGSPSSDGKDVFYAAPDMPGLAEVRAAVMQALASVGIRDDAPDHGWTPHVTLAYLDGDDDDPVDAVPTAGLCIEALTVSCGGQDVVIPLGGGESESYAEKTRRFADLPADDLFQFVAELKPFAEPPAWIQYLPTPGSYTHASYGKIDLTPARIANFVNQFNAGVYQRAIPIDAEHQTKLSGATGYVREMRVAADGSAEARVEWTPRGEKLIRGDAFKYFSPEWFDEWRDPVDERVYRDVAIGGALTTRPFFKEKALRPLAASEAAGAIVWADDDDAGTPARSTAMSDEKTAPVGMTEEQSKAFAEMQAELAAMKQANEAKDAEVKRAREIADRLADESLTRKFTDVALGRGGTGDGAPWYGPVNDNVRFLKALDRAFPASEDGAPSWEMAHFQSFAKATAEQLKQGGLLQSFGADGRTGDAPSAWDRIEAKAKELATAENKTFAQSVDLVLQRDHELAREYSEERRGRRMADYNG